MAGMPVHADRDATCADALLATDHRRSGAQSDTRVTSTQATSRPDRGAPHGLFASGGRDAQAAQGSGVNLRENGKHLGPVAHVSYKLIEMSGESQDSNPSLESRK